MSQSPLILRNLYRTLLSERARERSEKGIIYLAILSFLIHLLLIFLTKWNILPLHGKEMLESPISALYTPFSFILLYEVYLLVYYLPSSISTYIGKQYEIVTLIVIRRIFKDLSKLELTPDWFKTEYDLQFTYDIIATLLLFGLLWLFYRLKLRRSASIESETETGTQRFIRIKKTFSLLLVPILVGLSIYSFSDWLNDNVIHHAEEMEAIYDVNRVFFDDFFTLLILIDVLLLLFSFSHTDAFHTVIRNSGFTISTILIKISFGTTGLLNSVLVVSAVAFGVGILWLHGLYETNGDESLEP